MVHISSASNSIIAASMRQYCPSNPYPSQRRQKRGPVITSSGGHPYYAVIEKQPKHVATILFDCGAQSLFQVVLGRAREEASRAARSPLIIACTQGPMLSIVALQERAPAAQLIWIARVLIAACRAAKGCQNAGLAAC